MDWRSFFERALFGAVAAALLCACGRHAVRATEKEFLADRVMSFDDPDQKQDAEDAVLERREGSSSQSTAGGAGCR